GTSAPELAVCIKAALEGRSGLAVGNVVGSNIFNVLGILGVTALAAPVVVHRQLTRIDLPVMVLASVVLVVMSVNGRITRLDGLILFSGLVAYTAFIIRSGRREARDVHSQMAEVAVDRTERAGRKPLTNVAIVVLGLTGLILGADWLVQACVALARSLRVSELVIGLTIVAVGTSLPELATSVLAGRAGRRDIAVGNIVGSNTFNILSIIGLSAMIHPLEVAPQAVQRDMPVMLVAAIACIPIFLTGRRVSRLEGALFVGAYAAYAAYLIWQSGPAGNAP
ncbi:MAG: calcium/sodium antiporter, partial [Tepidisphaeraceae bacterium]